MDRWGLVELIKSRLADEEGTLIKTAPVRVALCYPSPYHVGMSSLGFQTIYREIHKHQDATAERAFLPDDVAEHRKAGLPLVTYETNTPVAQLDIMAFSVAYELEITGLFEMLSLAGLPLLARDRTDSHPIVIAGGPLTFSNPAPLEPFVDLIICGEAEESIHQFLDAFQGARNRSDLLESLAHKKGFHVPLRTTSDWDLGRACNALLPAYSQIITPNTELRSMFLIEAERGCSRGCTYCVMRRTTNGGMRLVPKERALGLIPASAQRVGLVGAAVTDHPQLEEIIGAIVESGRQVGISSLRAERLTPGLVKQLAQGGYKTLTVALDGASKRLREAIDRRTTQEHVIRAAHMARDAGIKRLKIYELVGLPNETEQDVDELGKFVSEVASILPVSLGIAPFAAKRNTPLDGAPFEAIPSIESKLARLRRAVRGRVEMRPTSTRWAYVEYMLAQCGSEAGLAAMDAWAAGGSFGAWKKAFSERSLKPFRSRPARDGRLRIPPLAWLPHDQERIEEAAASRTD